MYLTLTNLEEKSGVLWVPFFCVLGFTLYACWLLKVGSRVSGLEAFRVPNAESVWEVWSGGMKRRRGGWKG
jgi:hypothetical protein